ncbi:WASH complex subunit 2 isoform X2 [Tribolium castaneum]|uniref:WASH complex subunit 2 isoform X2 n=1 Tax=Tribolium castaneum TaxID=7070 RepID=UPI0030FE3088
MSGAKPWERPWSMDEIIQNSDNWNLAGDVALLNTLKAFADNLLTRTTEINNNLQNLTSSLSETSLQLNIAQNEFQSLRNSQFIESRVYEDDETLEEPVEAKAEEKEVDKTEEIRLAALKGLEVLETYFEKVEVSVSDSEDDDIDLPNFVLRPKDLYLERPLPYVIGSEEWQKTWHVGLEDSSSDSETEKVSDNFSESDSESELPIIPDRTQIKGTSDTSSEDLRTEPKNFVNSSDSENSVPVQPTTNFAEELAAKLGNVIDQEYVNRRPIQKTPQYDNLFFDEPPPLDEPKGLFSGGKGLFDDDDEATPPTPKPELRQPPKQDLFDSDDDDIFTKKTTSYLQNPVKMPLFSDEPPALDDKKVAKPVGGVSIFGGGDLFDKKLLRRQPSSDEEENEKSSPKGRGVNLFEEEPSDEPLVPDDHKFVKPVGGVSIFGGGNLFDKKLLRRQPSSSDDEQNEKSPQKGRSVNLFEEEPSVKPKKVTLFDDDDDLFKDDLFSSNATRKFTSGLFDDDLFAPTKPETKNSTDLFADLMAIPDDKNSINVDRRETQKEAESPKPKPRLSLFEPDDLFASTSAKALFDPSPPPDHETTNQGEGPPPDHETPNQVQEEESVEKPPPLDANKTNKPGKLKHNLNINVGALRPGSFPPKQTDGAANATEAPPRDHHTSFDEADNVTVLPSVTKDRARRPLNRRPSTRKGRKEALKKFEQANSTSRDPILEVKSDKNDSNSAQNRLEEPPDDLFETGSQKTGIFDESRDTFAVKTQPNLALFDEPPDDDFFEKNDTKENPGLFDETSDDLFDIKRNSPEKDLNRSLGLFEEPPDDLFESRDDIFKVKSETKPSRDDIFEVKSESKRTRDDIFGFKSETTSSREIFEDKSDTKLSRDDIFEVKSETKPSRDDIFEVKSETKQSRDIFEAKSETSSHDIFEEPPDLFESTTEKGVKSEPKADLGLFDEVSDDDLFGTKVESEVKPVESRDIPKIQSSQVKSDIFGDEDDDDDLFNVKKMPIQSNKAKKSLFDDEDDDDIFKSFSSASVKKPETKVATEKKVPKVSTIKKLENTKPDDDPLSALLQ